MKHYAGLDVSVKETSVCILDEAGGFAGRSRFSVIRRIFCGSCRIPPGAWRGLGSKRVSSRNGYSTGWQMPVCLLFVSRRATPKPF